MYKLYLHRHRCPGDSNSMVFLRFQIPFLVRASNSLMILRFFQCRRFAGEQEPHAFLGFELIDGLRVGAANASMLVLASAHGFLGRRPASFPLAWRLPCSAR